MKRSDLVSILKLVSPALSTKDVIPIMSCFCFDGKKVTASDEMVTITAKCPTPIKGGVTGRTLLDWASACRGKAVLFEEENAALTVKCGRARVKLPMLSEEGFLHSDPEEERPALGSFLLQGDHLRLLKIVASSMGEDLSHPWRIGVTIVFTKTSEVHLYSSDNLSGSHANFDFKAPKGLRGKAFILPPKFLNLLGSKAGTLTFGEDWIKHSNDERIVWCNTLSDVQPERYVATFEGAQEAADGVKAVALPKGLHSALERSLVLLSTSPEKHARLRVNAGKMYLEVDSPLGNSKDILKIDASHPSAREVVLPDAILRALPHASQFQIIPEMAIRFADEGFEHLVSIVAEETEE